MRHTRKLALLCALLPLTGCRKHSYVPPETPMPPNTILLSQMMRDLTAQHPELVQQLIDQIDKGGKKGPALLTPALVDELRKRILGKDWGGLDRFPGWTMREVNPTVRVIGHEAGKNDKLEDASAVHPGAPLSTSSPGAPGPDSRTRAATQLVQQYLDLGPYALDKAEIVSLDQPSTLPGFTTQGIVTDLGDGVVRGDGPNNLAPEHAESQRLADVLNRLAANKLDGAQTFTAEGEFAKFVDPPMPMPSGSPHDSYWRSASTPEELIELLAQTHTVTVDDARYFANFGHMHYNGQDVMMPFFLNSEIIIPNSGGRALLVPASHAEYEWHIRGPRINADVSYYFGIDGKSEWRTMDTLDQPWVLKRNAHEYTGAQAVEVTRLAGLLTVAYMHLHAAHPALPFGGYYALGVCQDTVSAIEQKLTGHVTLYPNTADDIFFTDSRDAEVNAMIHAIPKDREGARPEPERVFGSLPVAPDVNSGEPFSAITIPGLASDLNATYAAWQDGTLQRTATAWQLAKAWLFLGSAILIGMIAAVYTLRFQTNTADNTEAAVNAPNAMGGFTQMATAKKSSSKKSSAKKSSSKKSSAKKSTAKKSSAKKSTAKKSSAKKSTAKKSSAKKSTRKYDPSVGKRVEREMHEMHHGKLKSGRSGKKVTNPKQAIAIALSEKRREGAKVPAKKSK